MATPQAGATMNVTVVSDNGAVFFGVGGDPPVVGDVEAFADRVRAAAADSRLAPVRSAE